MGLIRPTNGYEKYSDLRLLGKGYSIHQSISTRTLVFPLPTPTMVVLKDALDDYQTAVNAAAEGGRVLIAQKNVARQKVIDLLHQLTGYVIMIANGDRLIAVESGIPLAKEPTPIVITKPTHLKVLNSDQEGELLVSVKKVKGAAAYMHQSSTDPLLKEESWTSMTCTSTKCKLTGLTPGTTYYVRVAAVGPKDQLVYSDVVSKKAA